MPPYHICLAESKILQITPLRALKSHIKSTDYYKRTGINSMQMLQLSLIILRLDVASENANQQELINKLT